MEFGFDKRAHWIMQSSVRSIDVVYVLGSGQKFPGAGLSYKKCYEAHFVPVGRAEMNRFLAQRAWLPGKRRLRCIFPLCIKDIATTRSCSLSYNSSHENIRATFSFQREITE